jgi:hypothetical protein
MSRSGSAAAFATTAAEPNINEATRNAAATYFATHTGAHYSPHVTIGVGTVDYPNALLAAPISQFRVFCRGSVRLSIRKLRDCCKTPAPFKLTQ